MLKFQPPGFGRSVAVTSLGAMAYYTPVGSPWNVDQSLPVLMFLHNFGGGASAYEWSKVYPAFALTHRVIAPDLIGWGASDHPARTYRVEDYLTTIAEFIQKMADRPITVVASSLTGAIVARLAVQRPELFQSLYLVCPSGFTDFGQDAGRRLPLELIGAPLLDRLIYTVGATNEFAVRNFLEQFLFSDRDRLAPETVAAYLESAQQPNAESAALAFLRGDLYFDLAAYLPQLTTPTAILWAESAQFTKLATGQRLATLSDQIQFQAIPNVGILPQLEQPSVVIGLLSQWLHVNSASLHHGPNPMA
jgi:pimeloyl-ACP methyl ester carboxylesterase